MDDWHSWKGWVFDKTQAPHGPMLFEMTHFTDVCNWFLADMPIEVSAVAAGMLNEAVIIRYSSGALATIVLGQQWQFSVTARNSTNLWATAPTSALTTCSKFAPRASRMHPTGSSIP